MRPGPSHTSILIRVCVIVICVWLGANGVTSAMVDLNGNGMSDVWELMYGASGTDPNADADGDGFSNFQEAVAGTDPFNSNSYPHISFILLNTPTNFSVTVPCVLGKVYQLQSVTTLPAPHQLVGGNLHRSATRLGTNLTLPAAVTVE